MTDDQTDKETDKIKSRRQNPNAFPVYYWLKLQCQCSEYSVVIIKRGDFHKQ